jgi:septum site-determining protein MinC
MSIDVSKLKITYNIFEYYTLHIVSKNNLLSLENKLKNFSETISDKYNLIIKFSETVIIEDIQTISDHIIDLCDKYNIKIYAFDIPEIFGINNLLGINVINIPVNSSKENIFTAKTLNINEPVRSGVKIFNEGDIVITSFVSPGAEIIATGNIHIYGELRGKAIAGANGDVNCKIFINKFNPELVSIAGYYRVFEEKLSDSLYNKSVMVELDGNKRISIKII